jgi:hypothetical protein
MKEEKSGMIALEDLFLNKGGELFIENRNNFERVFSSLNLSVSKRTEGRKNIHRERYTFFNYLKILNNNNKLEFPFKINKSDNKSQSPDFFIETDIIKIGIEVTEATDKDMQEANTELERLANKSVRAILEVSHYNPFNKNKKVSFRGIKINGQNLDGPGWVGDEVEEYWNEYILTAIDKKLRALNEPQKQYKMADKYILLIKDETPTDGLDFRNALELSSKLIFGKINLNVYAKIFGEISILRSSKLIYDLEGEKAILDMA